MKKLLAIATAAMCMGASLAHADATVVYQLQTSDSEAVAKKVALSRFFARVDSSDGQGRYLLFQAGKFFPLFRVHQTEKTYTRLTPPVEPRLGPLNRTQATGAQAVAGTAAKEAADGQDEKATAAEAVEEKMAVAREKAYALAEPDEDEKALDDADEPREADDDEDSETAAAESVAAADIGQAPPAEVDPPDSAPPPQLPKAASFKATGKKSRVGEVRCRVVVELLDGKPGIEHCMANKAALGITEREIRSLARLFVLARQRGWDWLGAATGDEEFVSVRSRDLARGKTLTLTTVSTEALPMGHLRIPRDFSETEEKTD